MAFAIQRDYLQQTLVNLVRINSINPECAENGTGETEIAHMVYTAMRDLGLETTRFEIAPNRWNVVGILRGNGGGKSLLLNAHLDTVGVDGMSAPFSAAIRDNKLYGRGSYDMKGSLAAMLAATKALIDERVSLKGDLLVTAVADEEHMSIGMEHLVQHVTADAAIVTEPTELQLCLAHRGFIWYDIKTVGRAAHGSRFLEGIDANMHMGRILAGLDSLEKALRSRPPHPLAGPPSLHAAKLHGGSEISIYAANCHLQVERRTIPGETVAAATGELQAILDRLSEQDASFNASINASFSRQPFSVSAKAPISQAVAEAVTNRLGSAPTHIGQTFWTDAALLDEAGIETVIIGPAGHGLHSAEEWVDLQSVEDLAHILADTAVTFCNQS